jgi:hypothetical protein
MLAQRYPNLKLKAEEDAVRELFINESPPVDPYYHLIDVFADKDSFNFYQFLLQLQQ